MDYVKGNYGFNIYICCRCCYYFYAKRKIKKKNGNAVHFLPTRKVKRSKNRGQMVNQYCITIGGGVEHCLSSGNIRPVSISLGITDGDIFGSCPSSCR